MKIRILSEKKNICRNESCYDNYFAWPTVVRLKNGKLAMVASGYLTSHFSPIGKGVMCLSEDEGKTWTQPMIVLDGPLVRGGEGVSTFGKSGVFINGFSRHMGMMREWVNDSGAYGDITTGYSEDGRRFLNAYLDLLEKQNRWRERYGAFHRISHDNGVTWSDYMASPVCNIHGNAELPDGTMLCIGNRLDAETGMQEENLSCYRMFPDGTSEFMCELELPENVEGKCIPAYEPHAIVTQSGKVIVHIRCEEDEGSEDWGNALSIYQSESIDGGRSFSKPHAILPMGAERRLI